MQAILHGLANLFALTASLEENLAVPASRETSRSATMRRLRASPQMTICHRVEHKVECCYICTFCSSFPIKHYCKVPFWACRTNLPHIPISLVLPPHNSPPIQTQAVPEAVEVGVQRKVSTNCWASTNMPSEVYLDCTPYLLKMKNHIIFKEKY